MLRRALVASIALWALTVGAASASVRVVPSEVPPGEPVQLTFRVTNDRDGARTTKVEVRLPTHDDGVKVKPLAGWTHSEDGSTITWTGGTIAPGEYLDFDIDVGAVPSTDAIALSVRQTYDDGRVESSSPTLRVDGASHDHAGGGKNGLAVLAIVLACVGIVLAAVAYVTRRTNPADGPDQAPLP